MPTKGGVNMSLKLYDQLAEAAAVVNKTADYEKSIKEITEAHERNVDLLKSEKLIAKSAKKRFARGVLYDVALVLFGIFMACAVGVATTVYELFLIRNYGMEAFNETGNILFFSIIGATFVVIVPLVLCACGILYFVIDVVRKAKMSASIKNLTKTVAELERKVINTRSEHHNYQNENAEKVDFIPVKYRTADAIAYMIKTVEADETCTLEQAVELYESEKAKREEPEEAPVEELKTEEPMAEVPAKDEPKEENT